MGGKVTDVLFLCTHNSARSVLAESTLNALGGERFRAHSAGSHPSGRINPHAFALLADLGHDLTALRSKSWDEFSGIGAPTLAIVITVCGDAADEACPVWTGSPARAHWGLPDPSRVAGDDDTKRRAFAETQRALADRIGKLVALDLARYDTAGLSRALADIHATSPTPNFTILAANPV
ncbi:MAG: arsenate reductase ArsC [Hyphomicrobium sp.]